MKEDSPSITSFVNVLPTPDDPIRTVGLIAYRSKAVREKQDYQIIHQIQTKKKYDHLIHTLTASRRSLTGSCS